MPRGTAPKPKSYADASCLFRFSGQTAGFIAARLPAAGIPEPSNQTFTSFTLCGLIHFFNVNFISQIFIF